VSEFDPVDIRYVKRLDLVAHLDPDLPGRSAQIRTANYATVFQGDCVGKCGER